MVRKVAVCCSFSAGPEFEKEKDPWKAQYFSRAMDNDMWMFSADYSTG